MKWNPLNLFCAITAILYLIPQLYIRYKLGYGKQLNRFFSIIEQVFLYATLVLWVLPVGVREFGFSSLELGVSWLLITPICTIAYLVCVGICLKKENTVAGICSLFLSLGLILFSAISLRHYILLGVAVVYTLLHIIFIILGRKGSNKDSDEQTV